MNAVVYIGPSIPARGLQKFQVFKGEAPIEHAVDDVLCALFVPVENLREARAALDVEGSSEWTAYRAAVAAFLSKK